ncbi:MAG TPA: bifunctional nuclease family protein [Acidimicrobiales bacterium]
MAGDEGSEPQFRVMDVMSVTVELPDQYPLVTLQEAEPPLRELSFRVGLPEGVALAYALRGVSTPRPLTHELFTTVLQRLRADLIAVRLVSRQGSTYGAEMDVMTAQGREVVPCRPSDGIVLAARQVVAAPILADERLLAGTGDVTPQ